MTLTHITSYEIDDEGLLRVHLLDYDPDTGEVSRRMLSEYHLVDDPGKGFEFVGLAEDYDDPATVWAVHQHPRSGEWAVETVSTSLEELRAPGDDDDD